MASPIKNKFAGFFRGLLRHSEDREAARPVNAAPTPAPTPVPASVPAPAPAPGNTAFMAAAAAAKSAPANDNEITLPLAAVIAHLPMDLKAKLMSSPSVGQTIALPVEKVIGQLAFGSVKISFGELRRLAPGVFANSGGELDNRQISLPLAEILSRLNPALLARKPVQKVDVAVDVAGPFDGRGRGITFTTQPLRPTAPEASRMNQPVPFTPPPVAPVATPAPAPVAPPRAVTPAPSADTDVFVFKPRETAPPSAPIAFTPPPSLPANGNANGNSNGHTNGNGHSNGHTNGHTNGNGNGNGNGHASLPPFKFATAPVPSAPVNSSSPRPEPAQPKVSSPAPAALRVSLDELAETWPDSLKQEIMLHSFANLDVPLPLNFVEAGLKRGKVTMTWKELRTLIKPSSPASPHDELVLDLPLKVLAPAFLNALKAGKTQKRLVVAEEIPNLFFGFPQPATEAVEPAASPSLAPAGAQVPPARAADTNFFTANDTEEVAAPLTMAPATDFINRHTHPQEIVARALVLPGVAGAVVALADGLRVASQVPPDMNADAMAAFLPQIFERVNQSTRELRMGALNNVGFTVGNVPWKIFRINSIYFAAFGRAGEALPKSQLAGLAAELDRKKQF
ncbi:MAG TPA: roadblock/LC7 domain-containing protein [Verrucomicrobiae bacterium]|nr:roadblock/LC7 domain-containing protein [Verrucomicrobiae bacterium]